MIPFFSIVIPTKDRSTLAIETVETVLRQTFTNFELLVIDNNSSQQGLKELLPVDKRIRYEQTGGLTMIENWEYGLRRVNGTYTIILADKMGLKINALMYLQDVINAYKNIDALTYEYDAFFDEEKCYEPRVFHRKPIKITPQTLLKKAELSKWAEYTHFACRGYNSCIKTSILKNLLSDGKSLYTKQLANPDYSLGYHLLASKAEIVHINENPVVVRFKDLTGKDGYGNGNSYKSKGKRFLEYYNELLASGYDFSKVPIKGYLTYNTLTSDMLEVLGLYNLNCDVAWPEYFLENYKETLWRQAGGTDVEDEIYLIGKALSEMKSPQKYLIKIKLLFVNIRAKLYCLRQTFFFEYLQKLRRAMKGYPATSKKLYTTKTYSEFMSSLSIN